MKNTILYLFSIIAIIIAVYSLKNYFKNKGDKTDITTELSHSNYIRAEIEVLNGCGEAGIANLFTKFLRSEGYDVIEIKNWGNNRIKKKQEECKNWWNNYKINLQEIIKKKVEQ